MKGTRFHWDEKVENNFQKLKELLVSPPFLLHIDYSLPMYILTDTSEDTVGAARCHRIEDRYRPIAFYTAMMNGAQKNNSISEKEVLAMYIALKHFEPTIEEYHISIITDHSPLLNIFEAPHEAPSSRLKRWTLYMQLISYDIQYHEVKTNYLADNVSRLESEVTLPENDCPDLFPQKEEQPSNAVVTRSKVKVPKQKQNQGKAKGPTEPTKPTEQEQAKIEVATDLTAQATKENETGRIRPGRYSRYSLNTSIVTK